MISYTRIQKALKTVKVIKIASFLISASLLLQPMTALTAVSTAPTMIPDFSGGTGFYTPNRGFYLTKIDYWVYTNESIKGFIFQFTSSCGGNQYSSTCHGYCSSFNSAKQKTKEITKPFNEVIFCFENFKSHDYKVQGIVNISFAKNGKVEDKISDVNSCDESQTNNITGNLVGFYLKA